MAGHTLYLLLLVSTLLLVLTTAEEQNGNTFKVIGKAYCDTCQCGFETALTTYITGAIVKLQCLDRNSLELELEAEGVTNENGEYEILVTGDRGDDICDVSLVSSPLDGCNVADLGRDKTRVTLTGYNGLVDKIRHANAMGFRINQALEGCAEELVKYKVDEEQ